MKCSYWTRQDKELLLVLSRQEEPGGYFKVSCWNSVQLFSTLSFIAAPFPSSPSSLPLPPFLLPHRAMYPLPDDGSPELERMLAHIPSTDPVSVIVRVYVIRVRKHFLAGREGVHDHIPCPMSPVAHCRSWSWKKEINDKDNYIPSQLNPIFGKMFELPAVLPPLTTPSLSPSWTGTVSPPTISSERQALILRTGP